MFGKTTVTAIPGSPVPSASSPPSLSSRLGLLLCSLNALGLKRDERCSGVHLVTLCPVPEREVGLQEAREGSQMPKLGFLEERVEQELLKIEST